MDAGALLVATTCFAALACALAVVAIARGTPAKVTAALRTADDAVAIAERTRSDFGALRESIDEERQAIQRARNRLQAERPRRGRANGGDDAPAMSLDQYRAHLEGGGAVLPEVERALGI